MRRVLLLLVGVAGLGVAVARTSRVVNPGDWRDPSAAAPAGVGRPTACLSADEIAGALRKFTSENPPEISEARALLRNKATESESCRREVVTALMKAMDQPDLDFDRDKNSYYLWRYGADLLGDLKASEALDLLVSHLSLEDKASFTLAMSHRPAVKGLIKMGPVAIPKLHSILKGSPDSEVRFYAAFCIAMIGGPPAVTSLREAAATESDDCVRHIISVSLDSFDGEGNMKDRGKWISSLACE